MDKGYGWGMTNEASKATTQWTKMTAGHYRSSTGYEAIRDSDGTGWALWDGNRRAAFVGTYAQAREEAASYAKNEDAEMGA
jgi:hypothetical protein